MKELKRILQDPTAKTPQVDFNHLNGDLILSGKSIPENAALIYEPLLKWVNEYVNNPRQTTNLRLNLEYFNTASSIWIAKIVKSLSRMKNHDHILFIHLYFELEEFDNMETEDIKDALSPVIDIISTATISIGVKIYGTDDNGKVVKESMVLL
ncbi:MAG: SiaC family regulatory phosphoprotein [Bacteroidales bacterium]